MVFIGSSMGNHQRDHIHKLNCEVRPWPHLECIIQTLKSKFENKLPYAASPQTTFTHLRQSPVTHSNVCTCRNLDNIQAKSISTNHVNGDVKSKSAAYFVITIRVCMLL